MRDDAKGGQSPTYGISGGVPLKDYGDSTIRGLRGGRGFTMGVSTSVVTDL